MPRGSSSHQGGSSRTRGRGGNGASSQTESLLDVMGEGAARLDSAESPRGDGTVFSGQDPVAAYASRRNAILEKWAEDEKYKYSLTGDLRDLPPPNSRGMTGHRSFYDSLGLPRSSSKSREELATTSSAPYDDGDDRGSGQSRLVSQFSHRSTSASSSSRTGRPASSSSSSSRSTMVALPSTSEGQAMTAPYAESLRNLQSRVENLPLGIEEVTLQRPDSRDMEQVLPGHVVRHLRPDAAIVGGIESVPEELRINTVVTETIDADAAGGFGNHDAPPAERREDGSSAEYKWITFLAAVYSSRPFDLFIKHMVTFMAMPKVVVSRPRRIFKSDHHLNVIVVDQEIYGTHHSVQDLVASPGYIMSARPVDGHSDMVEISAYEMGKRNVSGMWASIPRDALKTVKPGKADIGYMMKHMQMNLMAPGDAFTQGYIPESPNKNIVMCSFGVMSMDEPGAITKYFASMINMRKDKSLRKELWGTVLGETPKTKRIPPFKQNAPRVNVGKGGNTEYRSILKTLPSPMKALREALGYHIVPLNYVDMLAAFGIATLRLDAELGICIGLITPRFHVGNGHFTEGAFRLWPEPDEVRSSERSAKGRSLLAKAAIAIGVIGIGGLLVAGLVTSTEENGESTVSMLLSQGADRLMTLIPSTAASASSSVTPYGPHALTSSHTMSAFNGPTPPFDINLSAPPAGYKYIIQPPPSPLINADAFRVPGTHVSRDGGAPGEFEFDEKEPSFNRTSENAKAEPPSREWRFGWVSKWIPAMTQVISVTSSYLGSSVAVAQASAWTVAMGSSAIGLLGGPAAMVRNGPSSRNVASTMAGGAFILSQALNR